MRRVNKRIGLHAVCYVCGKVVNGYDQLKANGFFRLGMSHKFICGRCRIRGVGAL
jgi:hypothetical protein